MLSSFCLSESAGQPGFKTTCCLSAHSVSICTLIFLFFGGDASSVVHPDVHVPLLTTNGSFLPETLALPFTLQACPHVYAEDVGWEKFGNWAFYVTTMKQIIMRMPEKHPQPRKWYLRYSQTCTFQSIVCLDGSLQQPLGRDEDMIHCSGLFFFDMMETRI